MGQGRGWWVAAASEDCSVPVWHRGLVPGGTPVPAVLVNHSVEFRRSAGARGGISGPLIAGVLKGVGILDPAVALAVAAFGPSVAPVDPGVGVGGH